MREVVTDAPGYREDWFLEARRRYLGGLSSRIREVRDETGVWWEYGQSKVDRSACLAEVKTGRYANTGKFCERDAGAGTAHNGAGKCSRHGGNSERESQIGAWIMAHAYAKEMDCSPWEGLLRTVRIAAGKVAFCEYKLGDANSDDELEPGGRLFYWVGLAERWVVTLAKMSKIAIDAGVAERLVRQVELEGQLMVKAARDTFIEMGLSDEQINTAMKLMAKNVLSLEERANKYDIVDVAELNSIGTHARTLEN